MFYNSLYRFEGNSFSNVRFTVAFTRFVMQLKSPAFVMSKELVTFVIASLIDILRGMLSYAL